MIAGFSSSLSGMQAAQARLEVAANNVANVNTNGFKSSRVEQTSSFTQELRPSDASQPIGLARGFGAQVIGTSTAFSQGPLVRTDNPTDLSIAGDGFFEIVSPSGETLFTRSGDFVRDGQGFLRSPEGGFLSAGGAAVQIPNNATSFSIAQDGVVTAQFADGTSATIAQIDVATFANNSGLRNTGGGLLAPTPASGFPQYNVAGTNGAGPLFQGYLEASNVDIAREMVSQIIALRSFEANARVFSANAEASRVLTGEMARA